MSYPGILWLNAQNLRVKDWKRSTIQNDYKRQTGQYRRGPPIPLNIEMGQSLENIQLRMKDMLKKTPAYHIEIKRACIDPK